MAARPASPRYVRVFHRELVDPRFRRLTAAERGLYVTAKLLADVTYPDAIHESAVEDRMADEPPFPWDRLYDRGLLERDEDAGWFTVPELAESHVMPSETPEATAERKRRQRERERRDVTNVTGVTTVTTDETIPTRRDSESVEMSVGNARRGHRSSGLRPLIDAGASS